MHKITSSILAVALSVSFMASARAESKSAYLCELACGQGSLVVAPKAEIELGSLKGCALNSTLYFEGVLLNVKTKEGKNAEIKSYAVRLLDTKSGTLVQHSAHNAETGELEELHYLKGGVSLECKLTDSAKPDFSQKALLAAAPAKPEAEAAVVKTDAEAPKKDVKTEAQPVPASACPANYAYSFQLSGCVGTSLYAGNDYQCYLAYASGSPYYICNPRATYHYGNYYYNGYNWQYAPATGDTTATPTK